MEFKLYDFIEKSEMKSYIVTTQGKYNYQTGVGEPTSRTIPMFVYKKALKIIIANNEQGLFSEGRLNGKCLKVYKLEKGDVVEIETLKYRVTEILPRLHADFIEFTLELVRND